MARERLIKAKFFRSEDIAKLPFEGRLLFQSMWCHADRNGVLRYSAKLLKADSFPFDDVTAQQVQDLVSAMEAATLVKCFTFEGVEYVRILAFQKHQKPHPKEPQMWPFITDSGEVTAKPELVAAKSGKAVAKSALPSLSSSPSSPSLRNKTANSHPGFDEFYASYPRHEGKAAAIKAWNSAKPDLTAVLSALEWQREKWTDPKFTPMPATYLNQHRWEDDPPTPVYREGATHDATEDEVDAFFEDMRRRGLPTDHVENLRKAKYDNG